MPPLQDLALRLSDARKMRLEVFFHFILFLFLFIYFYNGLGFTDTQGFHPSEVWASFIPMLYITALPSKMSFGCNFFFSFLSLQWTFTFTGLITHKGHPLWSASPPQFCQASQCRNCLAQQAYLFFSCTLANHQGFLRVPPL